MPLDLSIPRVQRVRHEIVRRELTVRRVEAISPRFRAVTLGGDALAGFVSASFDDHLKLILPGADGAEPVRRDYTPRRFNAAANELTIEFALHGHGPAADWAAQAAPGQPVTIAGPRGSFVIAPDHDWHLLVGDESALPAIARRLEELPAMTRAIAVVQLADAADRRPLRGAADLQLTWVADDAALLDAVRALALPPGQGYAWCAGEAQAMAALRRLLVDEKGHDRHAIRAAAYWKRGAAGHHENLEG
ncbi:MAG: siderophore-interacting protein [Burkholderiales bacterium]|nr:siderophore-interacting protein [Burkholderiales bacterium]